MSSITQIPITSAEYELIDKDDTEVSNNDYTKTVDISVIAATGGAVVNGEIQSVRLVASELGSGAIRANAGVLFFFNADPNTSAGDTAITAAERKTIVGQVAIASGDWDSDGSGGSVIKITAIPFEGLSIIYCVFRNTGVAINDGAGDDEELHVLIRYRRDN